MYNLTMDNANRSLATVNLNWQSNPSYGLAGGWHEFEAVDGADIFRAFRHRSGYGWSWFEITKNGQPSSIGIGRQTELPRSFQEWR